MAGVYTEQLSAHPMVRCTWQASGGASGRVTLPASEFWGVAFTVSADGTPAAEVAGPSVTARVINWHAGDRYWGVDLEAHVFWRGLDKSQVLGLLSPLPTDGRFVELAGVRFPVPDLDGLEAMVDQLAGQGVIVAEPAVATALAEGDPFVSGRTLRRRFAEATGLRRGQIEQIQRARHAYALLQGGMSLVEAATETGYADQAHMTRSLRVLAGRSPGQILAG